MEIFKKVLKEIGIAILLCLVVAGIAAILFYDKIPFAKQIPESINYTNIDKNEFNVRGDVEDIANATETFMSKSSELRYYELIKYVLPGRHRPFGSVTSGSDLPSEYVGKSTKRQEDVKQDELTDEDETLVEDVSEEAEIPAEENSDEESEA